MSQGIVSAVKPESKIHRFEPEFQVCRSQSPHHLHSPKPQGHSHTKKPWGDADLPDIKNIFSCPVQYTECTEKESLEINATPYYRQLFCFLKIFPRWLKKAPKALSPCDFVGF